MVSERYKLGMVSMRMEARLENLKRDHANFRGKFDWVKDVILKMRNTLERLDNKVKNIEGGSAASQTVGERTMAEEHVPEHEIGHERKLEIPIFTGKDAIDWIFCVERYFKVNRLRKEEKVDAVVVYLEGKALN